MWPNATIGRCVNISLEAHGPEGRSATAPGTDDPVTILVKGDIERTQASVDGSGVTRGAWGPHG